MASNRSSEAASERSAAANYCPLIEEAKCSPSAQAHLLVERVDVGDDPVQKLSVEACWQLARKQWAADAIVEVQACGYNKGGLLVNWLGLPGFVPASQLVGLRRLHLEEERVRHLRQRQNAQLRLKIIEVHEQSNRLIFSERAIRVAAATRERLLRQIKPGEKRTGVVTNLADFGAFVDLGGVEGLIHLSQLSWRRLKHPSDVIRPGDTVETVVLNVDEARERVGLSRKQLLPDPWRAIEERYRPGQVVQGKVSSVVGFGAFILLEQELEGLIHVSELPEARGADPEAVLSRGDPVWARILHVSEEARRLGLTMRGVEQKSESAVQ